MPLLVTLLSSGMGSQLHKTDIAHAVQRAVRCVQVCTADVTSQFKNAV